LVRVSDGLIVPLWSVFILRWEAQETTAKGIATAKNMYSILFIWVCFWGNGKPGGAVSGTAVTTIFY
jgi:hypothetical protein